MEEEMEGIQGNTFREERKRGMEEEKGFQWSSGRERWREK